MNRQYLLTDGELQALFSAAMQYAHRQKELVQCMVWIEAMLTALSVHGPLVHQGDVSKIIELLGRKRLPTVKKEVERVVPLWDKVEHHRPA